MNYIFKSILTKLSMNVKETNNRIPASPQYYTFHALDINDAKYEDEFVEYKIPELVFHMLKFWNS